MIRDIYLNDEEEQKIYNVLSSYPREVPDCDVLNRASAVPSESAVTRIYEHMEKAGFQSTDIEAALAVTGGKGGVDPTLDWLVLYTPFERLPSQFSDKRAEKSSSAKKKAASSSSSSSSSSPVPDESKSSTQENAIDDLPIVSSDPNDYKLPDDILALLQQPSKKEEPTPVQTKPSVPTPEPKTKVKKAQTPPPAQQQTGSKKGAKSNTNQSVTTSAPHQRTPEEIAAAKAAAKGGRGQRMWTRKKEVVAAPSPQPVKGSYQEKEEWKKKAAALENQEKAMKKAAFSGLKPTPEEPLLPVSWTGKTPAMLLNEWCQKHKLAKPQYNSDKAPPMLHRLKVTVANEKGVSYTATTECAYGSAPSAKNAVATVALYFLAPKEQVYKMFPPYFRDMWQGFVNSEKESAEAEKKQGASKRSAFASQLKAQKQQEQQEKKKDEEVVEESVHESDSVDDDEIESSDELTKVEKRKQFCMSKKAMEEASKKIYNQYMQRSSSAEYLKMLEQREKLPAWKSREKVIEAIDTNIVTVITGQTGCGKSTQVPQFILDHFDSLRKGGECNIVCTQPRRISAITLANRVAHERCERPGETVGFQVRLHAQRTRGTRVLFCTTGILLRRLQGDPLLSGVTHVIVDEVHERDLDIDVLLAVLKRLISSGNAPGLKVVLMSATVDAEKFAEYFGEKVPVIDIGSGKHYSVRDFYLEDVLERTGHVVPPDSPCARRSVMTTTREGSVAVNMGGKTVDVAWDDFTTGYADGYSNSASDGVDKSKYSAKTIATLDRINEIKINYDLIEDVISYIDRIEAASGKISEPGAVLVFLPGMGEIQSLYDQLSAVRNLHWRLHVVPLHSTISPNDQQYAFEPPPEGRRKVILSTNIAETSVTINDVVYVIDTGRVKEFRYNRERKLRALTETWVSQASATQRRGRAGRVRDGVCFHLFTRPRMEKMDLYTTPEIKRIPLEEICLQILMLGLGPVEQFLGETLDPPSMDAISTAIKSLLQVGAISPVSSQSSGSSTEIRLTPLGKHLAALPLDVHVGKMLLYGCVLGCAGTSLTLAAALSTQSPFVTPFQREQEARAARMVFYAGQPYPSDHLALVTAFRQWNAARKSGGARAERSFCIEHFLSFQRMREVSELRFQLKDTVDSLLGFSSIQTSDADGGETDNPYLVQAVLCAGLYPHVLSVDYPQVTGSLPRIFTKKGEEVYFHNACVMARKTLTAHTAGHWMLYQEMIKTSSPGYEKVFVRDCTPALPRALLLLSGTPTTSHTRQRTTIDGWIELNTSSRVSLLFRRLRSLLSESLEQIFKDPSQASSSAVLRLIASLLSVPAQRTSSSVII